jgi:flavodoxin
VRATLMPNADAVRTEDVPDALRERPTNPEYVFLSGPMIGDGNAVSSGRRALLRCALVGAAGVVVGAQSSGASALSPTHMAAETASSPVATPTGRRVLLAYFSRAGENYYYGDRIDLEVGNTQVLAGMIRDRAQCDVYRIEPVDPYSDDYEETVARNVREQDANARPAIANALDSIAPYDVVLLGSPIWNVRAPMILSTFAERFDFTGKTIFPFVTYAVSGLGTVARDYTASCPGATIGEGLAVRGEEVRYAGEAVAAWLQGIGLLEGTPTSPSAP